MFEGIPAKLLHEAGTILVAAFLLLSDFFEKDT